MVPTPLCIIYKWLYNNKQTWPVDYINACGHFVTQCASASPGYTPPPFWLHKCLWSHPKFTFTQDKVVIYRFHSGQVQVSDIRPHALILTHTSACGHIQSSCLLRNGQVSQWSFLTLVSPASQIWYCGHIQSSRLLRNGQVSQWSFLTISLGYTPASQIWYSHKCLWSHPKFTFT